MERARETYWQEAWARAGIARAVRDGRREKFYAIVAYPGTSGFLHIGHFRGFTYADVFHRYHRMCGRAVFFPSGSHASGLPAVTFAQKVRERDEALIQQLRDNDVPESQWAELEVPEAAARFLGRRYLDVFRSLGLLIDESAYVTTIDEDYGAFIGWQFRRLHALGALGQAPHYAAVCPVCGPVSVDPSETDLSTGGDAEWVTFTALAFPLDDGRRLLAATLRPETVFGATNLWVHPSDPLLVWHRGSDEFLVGRSGGERLVEQHGGRLGHEVPVGSLLGRTARAALTGSELPILPSLLVDPTLGTGVVMSVPAHAPADWLAVQGLEAPWRGRVTSVPVVVEIPDGASLSDSERSLLAGEGAPAERAVRATQAGHLGDAHALEQATQRLYRLEFARGRMRRDLEGGATVTVARQRVADRLKASGDALDLQEFSKPVVCRNGHSVVIRKVPDQWFLRYSEPSWREKTRELVRVLEVTPEEYRRELPSVIEWFGDRPCVRRGRWLGTPFPLDPAWVIEPIADSTFYPAYYIVRRFVADGRVPISALTDRFFDFVFLGTGSGEPTLPKPMQDAVREEFLYWYPLDLNIGGKEHKRVHFPVFLATHALLLPPELRPRGLFVHWWLTRPDGEKISKRDVGKGKGIPRLRAALEEWGADALRLFYSEGANPEQDVAWDPELAEVELQRLGEVERLARSMWQDGPDGPPELNGWLESALHEEVRAIGEAFHRHAVRDAAGHIYGAIPAIVRRYLLRGGAPGRTLQRVASVWLRLMSPITPHLAEEIGEGRFPTL
ncbi:MAG: class I tRNA ligase family protein, partial [Thermoplasmata archaeon]|nr:class I tRNA ligase family protein [Thermoplasmata archaeon]